MTTFRILLLLLSATLLAAPADGQRRTAMLDFEAGNEHYRAGDFPAALDDYRAALAAGYASDALYYNMGNAYYRLDALGEAIRHYERALRLAPERAEIRHNLALARARIVQPTAQLPEPAWRTAWRGAARTVGAEGFFWSGLVFYLVALALVGARLRRRGRTAWHRRALAASAVAGIALLAAAFAAPAAEGERGVVLADETPLYPARDADAPALTIHEGTVVDVLEREAGLQRVRLPNGVEGWVAGADVGEI